MPKPNSSSSRIPRKLLAEALRQKRTTRGTAKMAPLTNQEECEQFLSTCDMQLDKTTGKLSFVMPDGRARTTIPLAFNNVWIEKRGQTPTMQNAAVFVSAEGDTADVLNALNTVLSVASEQTGNQSWDAGMKLLVSEMDDGDLKDALAADHGEDGFVLMFRMTQWRADFADDLDSVSPLDSLTCYANFKLVDTKNGKRIVANFTRLQDL